MNMKAAVLCELNKPLVVEELRVPKPDVGQVLVKVFASGICHTQLDNNAISLGRSPSKRGTENPDDKNELTHRTLTERIDQPNDLADVVILLASDTGSYITGQNIVVDEARVFGEKSMGTFFN